MTVQEMIKECINKTQIKAITEQMKISMRAWLECAVDFGKDIDELSEENEKLKERIAELEKAKEWQYVKEGCKYPENGESVLVTVLNDDNEKIVTMALFEVENNKRFWDIESRLCSVHSGSEEVCSKIIAWARVLPAGGEK